ncbi:aspartate/glutamate racemase family protein [Clostridium beijerinckii]|uniref:aspartate/glutamate racemase family protein n=1 Tax=Clostridium beijerinckii TaxID=1520 RepID=UPI00080A5044|nr:amino acid racemase [Clostridium beijerinckii]OCA97235.1 aspartate racemase [Clostridium beijerinckii]
MKKVGIVGGMGPESTIEYYNKIVYGYQEKHSKDYFPNMVIESINIFEMLELCKTKDFDALTELLLKAIKNVAASGADFAALAANTPHIVFEALKEKSPIPLISIVEETYKKVEKDKLKVVGLLGTSVTMDADFFKKPFRDNGIKIVVPEEIIRNFINDKITNELEYGIIKDSTKQKIIKIIKELKEREKVEGIILGCTELPFLLKDVEFSLNVYDTMEIHVNSILSNIINLKA